MKFEVSGQLWYQVNGPATVITSLHCMRTAGQDVSEESFVTSRPVESFEEISVGLGQSRFARLALGEAGEISFDYSAEVTTSPSFVPLGDLFQPGLEHFAQEVVPFLFPSRYCQSDVLRQTAADLFPARNTTYERVSMIVDWISNHLGYVSGSTDEQTSALEVLEKRAGVCRDFAHLGIAFCRALTIPARYTTVYAYQLQPQDFHACFEAYINGEWYLFDATNLAPLNGMVRISTGRDASDAAVATLFGDIMGTGLSVRCQCLDDHFQPVRRQDLENRGEAFVLA